MILKVLFFLLVPVFSQDILGIYYSFDVDHFRTFDVKGCGNRATWQLVNYDVIGVVSSNEHARGIRALEDSCTSSFSFALIPGSTLTMLVYIDTVTESSGIVITVMSADNTPLTIDAYTKSNIRFHKGWSRIAITINSNGFGYVNIKGKSRADELVLIDSFEYTPTNKHKGKATFDDEMIFVKPRYHIRTVRENIDFVEDFREGSGSSEEDDTVEEVIQQAGLTPLVIGLIVVGSVTVVGLVGVGFYHLGKLNAPQFNVDDIEVEPERVINIPRVRPVSTSAMKYD